MGSGGNKLLQQTREKVLSTDMNRRQALAANDLAQLERFKYNLRPPLGFESGAELDEISIPTLISAAHPTTAADIYQGLMVVPIEGTDSIHIVQGVIGIFDPDGQTDSSDPSAPDPDDNAYKIVRSAGINTDGVLEFAPNVSGLVRIDVVECQRQTVVVEQDNRDIYNPATGQFTPSLIDKLEDGELTFRIRTGTPGGGLPATEDGWIPLAVARVPDSFTSTDDMTFWDVRPLIMDRKPIGHGARVGQGFHDPHGQHWAHVDINAVPGFTFMTGHLEGYGLFGDTHGGRLQLGDVASLELFPDASSLVQEPGFAPAPQQIIYLWSCFPGGYPRWVRYQDTSAGDRRIPLGPKGVMVLSTTPPLSGVASHAFPSAPISMPVGTDLIVTTSTAVCLAALPTNGAGEPTHCTMDGQWTYLGEFGTFFGPATLNPGSFTFDEYFLVAGTHYPPQARAIRGFVGFTVSGAAAGADIGVLYRANVTDLTGGALTNRVASNHMAHNINTTARAAGTASILEYYELPIICPTSGISTVNQIMLFEWGLTVAGGGVKSLESITITGWKMAD